MEEVTLPILANALAANDTGKYCPFCLKSEWGKDNHSLICPFAIAYRALEQFARQTPALDEAEGGSE